MRRIAFGVLVLLFALCLGLSTQAALGQQGTQAPVVPANALTVPPPSFLPGAVGSAHVCYPTCIQPRYIVSEDINSDGWPDLAVACFGSSAVWTYTNAAGFFGLGFPGTPAGVGGVIALAGGVFGPINGSKDLAALGILPASVWQLVAGPPPVAAFAPPVALGGLPSPIHLATGDFNRLDGVSDIVVADTAAGGSLNFVVSLGPAIPPVAGLGFTPSFVAVADFNHAGVDDVAVCGVAGGAGWVQVFYLETGVPVPGGPPLPLGLLVPTSMDVADFNNDGFQDLVVVGNVASDGTNGPRNGYAMVLLNAVNPTGFVASPLPLIPTWGFEARFVETLDADGNGWADFAVANYGSNTVTVFLTNPIALNPSPMVVRPQSPQVCLTQGNQVRIAIEPKFKYDLECGYYPIGIAADDFDRNGKEDIAVLLASATKDMDPQQGSCLEVIFDVACGVQPGQSLHVLSAQEQALQTCQPCSVPPCSNWPGEPKK